MRPNLIPLLVAVAVIGALLDVGVFTFQAVQYGRIQQNANLSQCWAGVLDRAVLTHDTRAELTTEARACARRFGHVPASPPHRTRSAIVGIP